MTANDWVFYSKAIGAILSMIGLCVLAIWSPGVGRRWLRWSLRTVGIMLLLLTFLVIFLFSAFPKYTSVHKLPSPDGQFICYIKFGGSGATVDWTSITLRRAWKPLAHEVYFTFGGFDPDVRWKDSQTLQIGYPQGDDPQLCAPSSVGVNVVCSAAPRLEFYPWENSRH